MVTDIKMMQKEATALQGALKAIGCAYPVRLIEHSRAIEIDTLLEGTILVRHEGKMWQVESWSPTCCYSREYNSAEECAHEIAMCQVGCVFDDHDEERIDEAIHAALLN